MRRFNGFKTVVALLALCLLMGTMTATVAAQDDATAASPIVGVWVLDVGGAMSIASFGADGTLVDIESTGESGLGAWSATGPTSGAATFIMFYADENDAPNGSAVFRVTLEYDEATDSLAISYSVTGMMPDGTVISDFTANGTGTATRLPIEPVEMEGTPFAGFAAPPAATPAS